MQGGSSRATPASCFCLAKRKMLQWAKNQLFCKRITYCSTDTNLVCMKFDQQFKGAFTPEVPETFSMGRNMLEDGKHYLKTNKQTNKVEKLCIYTLLNNGDIFSETKLGPLVVLTYLTYLKQEHLCIRYRALFGTLGYMSSCCLILSFHMPLTSNTIISNQSRPVCSIHHSGVRAVVLSAVMCPCRLLLRDNKVLETLWRWLSPLTKARQRHKIKARKDELIAIK